MGIPRLRPSISGRGSSGAAFRVSLARSGGDMRRLVAAGATHVSGPEVVAGGDEVAMLRDPWGICVQLVKRAQPMLK